MVVTILQCLMSSLFLQDASATTQLANEEAKAREFFSTWIAALVQGKSDQVKRGSVGDPAGMLFLDTWLRSTAARAKLVDATTQRFGNDAANRVLALFPYEVSSLAECRVSYRADTFEFEKDGYLSPFLVVRKINGDWRVDVSSSVFPPAPDSAKSRQAHAKTAERFFLIMSKHMESAAHEVSDGRVENDQGLSDLLRKMARAIAADLKP